MYDTSLPGGEWKSPKRPISGSAGEDHVDSPVESSEPENDEEDEVEKDDEEVQEEGKQEEKEVEGSNDPMLGEFLNSEDSWTGVNTKKTKSCCGEERESEGVTANINYIYCDFGKEAELEKVAKRHQFWKYRKIFMDIERDQVQEKKKLEDHRRKVQQLKISKEQERKSAEKKMSQFPEKPLEYKPNASYTISKPIPEDRVQVYFFTIMVVGAQCDHDAILYELFVNYVNIYYIHIKT